VTARARRMAELDASLWPRCLIGRRAEMFGQHGWQNVWPKCDERPRRRKAPRAGADDLCPVLESRASIGFGGTSLDAAESPASDAAPPSFGTPVPVAVNVFSRHVAPAPCVTNSRSPGRVDDRPVERPVAMGREGRRTPPRRGPGAADRASATLDAALRERGGSRSTR
jgi:hypothetical protein